MCTYNITVDEQAIARLNPSISREDLGHLLQHVVDELVDSLICNTMFPPSTYTEEEMYAIVKERLQNLESGVTEFVDGETGFESLRVRYGFKGQVA